MFRDTLIYPHLGCTNLLGKPWQDPWCIRDSWCSSSPRRYRSSMLWLSSITSHDRSSSQRDSSC